MFHVYLLQSLANKRTYVGSTSKEVDTRLAQHNIGANQWTKRNRPFKMIYYESFYCKTDALHREKFLKSGIGNRIVKAIVGELSNGV